MANIGLLSEITAFGMYLFCMVFTTLISLVVTKCVRPLRGRLLLTPSAAGYVPLALHPRL